MANWYRLGADDGNAINSFRNELQEMCASNLGIVVLGDLNIHHIKWLRHSNANTSSGEQMQEICADFDLKQLIREPTRDPYLLNLCFTEIHDAKAQVLLKIADHEALLITLAIDVLVLIEVLRKV